MNSLWFFAKKTKIFLEEVARLATPTRMSDAESPTDDAQKSRVLGFQIPSELDAQLADAAIRLHLSKSSVARLAVQRGLAVLLEQLQPEVTP